MGSVFITETYCDQCGFLYRPSAGLEQFKTCPSCLDEDRNLRRELERAITYAVMGADENAPPATCDLCGEPNEPVGTCLPCESAARSSFPPFEELHPETVCVRCGSEFCMDGDLCAEAEEEIHEPAAGGTNIEQLKELVSSHWLSPAAYSVAENPWAGTRKASLVEPTAAISCSCVECWAGRYCKESNGTGWLSPDFVRCTDNLEVAAVSRTPVESGYNQILGAIKDESSRVNLDAPVPTPVTRQKAKDSYPALQQAIRALPPGRLK